MRRTARLLVACVLLLAGCSAAPAGTAKGGDSVDKGGSADDPATDSGAAPAGERGNQEAAVGDPVTVADDAGAEILVLTVESITPDYPCDGDEASLQDPVNGHFIGVQLVVTAGPGLAEFDNPYGIFTLTNNGKFTIVGSDGVTEAGVIAGGAEAYLCTAGYNELLTGTVEPGQTYRGVIVLDSANASGTLIWQPVLTADGPGPGWEWPY